MKAVSFAQFGVPHEVASVIDAPEPGAPKAGEVAIEFLCSPINPADLLLLAGNYGHRPALPALGGLEGVGQVTALGAGVSHLQVGDRVLLPGGNWAERMLAPAAGLFPLPADAPSEQLAMLTVNPPTAWGLLHDYVELKPGDWVIQNVANSAVGRLLIVLAKQRGLRTVNVVRRPELDAELKSLGADLVVVDGDDLAARVAKGTGEAAIRLGVEAIGGAATGRIVECIATEGTVVHYGSMSGEDPEVTRSNFIYRGVRLTGFMLGRGLAKRSPEKIREIYADLGGQVLAGKLHAPVDTVYPIEKIKEALAHADRGGRNGKILVAPNGPV